MGPLLQAQLGAHLPLRHVSLQGQVAAEDSTCWRSAFCNCKLPPDPEGAAKRRASVYARNLSALVARLPSGRPGRLTTLALRSVRPISKHSLCSQPQGRNR